MPALVTDPVPSYTFGTPRKIGILRRTMPTFARKTALCVCGMLIGTVTASAKADTISGATLAPATASVGLTTIAGGGTFGAGFYPGFGNASGGYVSPATSEAVVISGMAQGGVDPSV